MADNQQPNRTITGTNIQRVRQQNGQAGAGSQGQFGTEFAGETGAAQIGQQNR
ncbi:gamma-type small acid-soluble spore protein, partial [Bacillus canaveralius]